jgi:hypothetical protein
MLKFTLKITINALTCFGLTKPSSGSLRRVIRFSEPHRRLPDDGFVKPKHVGAFIVIFNVNFNISKQFKCALIGQRKDLITSKCTVQL